MLQTVEWVHVEVQEISRDRKAMKIRSDDVRDLDTGMRNCTIDIPGEVQVGDRVYVSLSDVDNRIVSKTATFSTKVTEIHL